MLENIIHTIATGIFATIAMTSFSYILSYFTKNEFEEPQLLNKLINNSPKNLYVIQKEHVLGWTLHIFIGIIIVAIYDVLLNSTFITIDLVTGAIFGFVAGVMGVGFWHITFFLHPCPPKINKILFYMQLVPAHVIFGLTMIVVYQNS